MQGKWGFYGRAAEAEALRTAFLSGAFGTISIRGHRRLGKTWLIGHVVRGLPAGIPVFRHGVAIRHSPEAARKDLLHELEPGYGHASGSGREVVPKDVREAASALQGVPEILEHLLRAGINVVVDNADRLQDEGLPGLVGEIGDMARKLHREEAARAGATVPPPGRRGALVLSWWFGMSPGRESLLDALGPGAVGRSMLLGPWSAADLVALARDRGWLDRPRRLALVRAAIGGRPLDWERFASRRGRLSRRKRVYDFAAWPSDRAWRLGFARYLFRRLPEFPSHYTDLHTPTGYEPELRRLLDFLAADQGKGRDTESIHAAFPSVAPELIDRRLAFLSGELGVIEEVPGAPGGSLPRTGSGDGEAGRGWRICDLALRFWYDALHDLCGRTHFGAEILAERMKFMEEGALAQFLRECGPAWPADRSGHVRRGLPGKRAAPGPGKAGPVERRAFAFDVTAPGVLEGLLVPCGVPVRIGGAFEEVFEPGSLLANNGLLVNVLDDWESPLARSGKGLELEDGAGGLRATVTLPDTIDGRRVRARVEAGELTAFSAAFQALEEDWPAPDRRIVRQARLVGLALVDRPEHETPLIEEGRGRLEAGEPAPFRRW